MNHSGYMTLPRRNKLRWRYTGEIPVEREYAVKAVRATAIDVEETFIACRNEEPLLYALHLIEKDGKTEGRMVSGEGKMYLTKEDTEGYLERVGEGLAIIGVI